MEASMFARRFTLLCAVTVVLGFPRVGHASIWDFIFEMSGAQQTGIVVLTCRFVPEGGEECRLFDIWRITPSPLTRGFSERRAWVTFETGVYTSTQRDSEGIDYRGFRHNMAALESTLDVRPYSGWARNIYHGVIGGTYNILKSGGSQLFHKGGLKFRPLAATFGPVDLNFSLRVYPRGFTPEEFGFPASPTTRDNEWERVYGATVGFKW
jgi:hypothetical protein